jgi:excisionase family DNA binding protein
MHQPATTPHTLTLQEACDVLRITRRTATSLIERGELTAFKVGQAWRIDPADLAAYIERQKQAARGSRQGERTA